MIEKGAPGYGMELRDDHGRYFLELKKDYESMPAEVTIDRSEHRPMLPTVTSSLKIVTTLEAMLQEGWRPAKELPWYSKDAKEEDLVIVMTRGFKLGPGWDGGWANEKALVVVRSAHRLMWDPD